jgi:soluble lytic murein transglycosylase
MTIIYNQSVLIKPVNLNKPCPIEAKMISMGYPKHLAPSIKLASSLSNLPPELIIALIKSESDFKEKAISKKGYKGLMQIPYALYDPNMNVTVGSLILVDKIKISKGDLITAICLYKGFNKGSKKGMEIAKKVVDLYEHMMRREAI